MTNQPPASLPPVSIVTGASSGIGQAIAIRLAKAGHRLIIHFHSNQTGIDTTARALEQLDTDFLVLQADFQDSEQIGLFCEKSWDWKGGVQFLVNNAGGDVLTTTKKNWTFEQKVDYLWNLDVRSTLLLSRNLGQKMQSQVSLPKPGIINIGWDQAPLGQAGENGQIFSTTKGAIMAFTRSLAKSLAPEVRVNCLAPGWIRTSWGDNTSDYWDQRAKSESLLDRWGTPEDVAQAVVQLVHPDSEFINGQTIEVNGGLGFGRT